MRLCGLHWRPGLSASSAHAPIPTLALHGWLDNAGSFSLLAPQLPNHELLAIDMPGHGLSTHRPAPGAYNLWDDLLDILALADHLGWSTFNLLGHSRGALIAVLLAATMPERVNRLALLDGIWPMPVEADQAPTVLRRYLMDQRSVAGKEQPRYESVSDAVSVWQKASGLHREAAELLMERGLQAHSDGGFTWRSDPRLKTGSAVKLSERQSRAFLDAVQAPVLALLASRGYGAVDNIQETLDEYAHVRYQLLAADHHLHMGPHAASIGAALDEFLA